jgi:hypothetical protein
MSFIEVHPLRGVDSILVNMDDIETVYESNQNSPHAVLRLHGDALEVKETYAEVKSLIGQTETRS